MEGGIDQVNFAKYNPNRSRIVSKLLKGNSVLGIRIVLKRVIFCTLTYSLKEEFEIETILNTIELVSKGRRLQICESDVLFKMVGVNEFRENFCKRPRSIGITIHKELKSPVDLDLERVKIIMDHHKQCTDHLGFRATILSIRREFYWRDMSKEIMSFLRKCEKCKAKYLPQQWVNKPSSS